jgi:hypothetical protein
MIPGRCRSKKYFKMMVFGRCRSKKHFKTMVVGVKVKNILK